MTARPPQCGSRPARPARTFNEGDEDVEMWAISRQLGRPDATRVDDFWEASPDARQARG